MLIERQKRESVGNRVLGANVGLRGARMTVVYFTTLVSFCDIAGFRKAVFACDSTHKCVYCIVPSFSPLLVLCIL